MNVFISKKFNKMFKKCPQEIKKQFIERLKIFKENEHNPILNNHSLSGKLLMFPEIIELFLKKNQKILFL